MKVLAIETATAVCAAAVVEGATVLQEQVFHEKHIHSEKLVTFVDAVTLNSGDFEAIAISIGPGSFTGLRIGLSVAKGLAYANDKRIVAVPTLEALAWRAVHEGIAVEGDTIVAMIDARRNDVYAGMFSMRGEELESRWEIAALPLDELMQRLDGTGRVVVMGDAVAKFAQRYGEVVRNAGRFVIPAQQHRLCNAGSVGLLGARKATRGEFSDLGSLEPRYVKDFVSLVRAQHVSS